MSSHLYPACLPVCLPVCQSVCQSACLPVLAALRCVCCRCGRDHLMAEGQWAAASAALDPHVAEKLKREFRM